MHRILIIDDNESIHGDFQKILAAGDLVPSRVVEAEAALFGEETATPVPTCYELDSAFQGQEGLEMVRTAVAQGRPYVIAFVDMRMPPGWNGMQTVLKLWEADPELQVVICTAYSDQSWEEISRTLVRVDQLLILKKPFDSIEVSQLAAALSRKWELRRQAMLKVEELEILVQERTTELSHTATHDKLTGLPNRVLLLDQLQNAIARQRLCDKSRYAVLFLDLDRFKTVNDILGHAVGDELLCEIAKRLHEALRSSDCATYLGEGFTAARLGGDEFVVLLEGLRNPEDAQVISMRLLDVLAQRYKLGKHDIVSTASIGIVTGEQRHDRAEDVLRDADTAMYEAKLTGRGRVVVFDASMRERVRRKEELENDLRKALEAEQFELYYQPIISLESGALESFEALVRWHHPQHGLIAPTEFIPIAEESGLIIPIDDWVFREACRQLGAWWRTHGRGLVPSISVNLSRKQLANRHLPRQLLDIAIKACIDPTAVHLEITESAIMRDIDLAADVLRQLKGLGFKVDMDDFGIGYSSLASLHQLPIDLLKIDRSFIANLNQGRDFPATVNAIITLASNMGIHVVAEGIETADQVSMLQSLDCKSAQGYFFARPMSAEQALVQFRGSWGGQERHLGRHIENTPAQAGAAR